MSVVVVEAMPSEPEKETPTVTSDDYCVISRPDSLSFPKIGDCSIPNDEPGLWNINIGLQGKNMEVQKQVFHEPKSELYLLQFLPEIF